MKVNQQDIHLAQCLSCYQIVCKTSTLGDNREFAEVQDKCDVNATVEQHYGENILLCSKCLGVIGRMPEAKIQFAKNKCRITRIQYRDYTDYYPIAKLTAKDNYLKTLQIIYELMDKFKAFKDKNEQKLLRIEEAIVAIQETILFKTDWQKLAQDDETDYII